MCPANPAMVVAFYPRMGWDGLGKLGKGEAPQIEHLQLIELIQLTPLIQLLPRVDVFSPHRLALGRFFARTTLALRVSTRTGHKNFQVPASQGAALAQRVKAVDSVERWKLD